MSEIISEIISFLTTPEINGWLLAAKFVFLFFAFIFIVIIILGLLKTTWLERIMLKDMVEFFTLKPYSQSKFKKIWDKITGRKT